MQWIEIGGGGNVGERRTGCLPFAVEPALDVAAAQAIRRCC
jgi:hypothetical protein